MKSSFTCATLLAAAGVTICTAASGATLSGTVRDFRADGVNFEGPIINCPGAVQTTLVGSSPTLTSTGSSCISNSGAGAFSNWYTKSTDS
ncbi:MAG: hypothetical protein WBC37_16925, partial [Burkholderiaceae bacterium]